MPPRFGSRIDDNFGKPQPDDKVLFEEHQALPVVKIATAIFIGTICFFGIVFVGIKRPDAFALVGFLVFLVAEAVIVVFLRKVGLLTQVVANAVRVGVQLPNVSKGLTRFELSNLASLRTGTWESLGVPSLPFSPGRPLDDKTTVITAGSERAVRLEFKDGRVVVIGSTRADRLRTAIESTASGRA